MADGIHLRMSDSKGTGTQRGRTLLALREMVLKGSFPPVQRLEEVELGRSLGVSRRILSSVFEELSSEGLLVPLPSGGYSARQITIEDIRDAILARSTLEGLAARLAAQRLRDPAELVLAKRLNAELFDSIVSFKHLMPVQTLA